MYLLELETAGQFERDMKSADRNVERAEQTDEIVARDGRRRPAIPLFSAL
jgi:hypothetical protein